MALCKVHSRNYVSTGVVWTFNLCAISGAQSLALMESLEAHNTPASLSLLKLIKGAELEPGTKLPDRSMTQPVTKVVPPIIVE